MQRILIVEDDIIINRGIREYLEKRGYVCESSYSVREARELIRGDFGLVILDIGLPDGNGFLLCREIRGMKNNIPLIFLTANDAEEDVIEGFLCGCDDYITKPFSVGVLEQRVKAVLRRSRNGEEADLFTYLDLAVDFGKKRVFFEGNPIKLSATEFKILELLIQNRGQVLTRNMIYERVWDCNENYVDDNTLSVYIRRLRQKLEPNPQKPVYILTVFGIGYTFGE